MGFLLCRPQGQPAKAASGQPRKCRTDRKSPPRPQRFADRNRAMPPRVSFLALGRGAAVGGSEQRLRVEKTKERGGRGRRPWGRMEAKAQKRKNCLSDLSAREEEDRPPHAAATTKRPFATPNVARHRRRATARRGGAWFGARAIFDQSTTARARIAFHGLPQPHIRLRKLGGRVWCEWEKNPR
uniref:Uncharacterized protein n=1 Tax=Plectus sambesii TaxID=2011161 RepID=A0A914UK50_9BILA